MNNKNMLVSIITITYNSEKTISTTLDSILNQTYANIEYIIIDGKSEDNTLNIINAYIPSLNEKGIRTKIISEKDYGIADAWNKGLKHANGNIIGILNSDDWYDKNVVELATRALNPEEKQISYGICKQVNTKGEIIHTMNKNFSSKRVYLNFGFSHTTCFVTRTTYESVGYFNLDYQIAMDVDFLLRSLKSDVQFIKTNTVTNMRMGGISTANKKRALQEYQQALKKNGFNRFLIGIFGNVKKVILFLNQSS